ncbi:imidazoleglycerol-phosphate dehydratase [Methanomethylophilus alvi]|uniref:imidazoleglycerol-phosphate dehydratase n=1 Tax=Methanomethylophilus alvi TaxID=1291540 RepID=UPI0037DDC6C0
MTEPRKARLERSTRETKVYVELDVDGTGKFDVDCDIQFLKHMTETFARYAQFDLVLKAGGDNDHHVIEDTAIAMGEAVKKALGDAPVERTASCILPMDDALVMVALDLVDRPYADIDCPDPLYTHFFRSFAMSAGITLHIVQIRGFDEHHLVEASFKALGKALYGATRPRGSLLSTKDAVKMV